MSVVDPYRSKVTYPKPNFKELWRWIRQVISDFCELSKKGSNFTTVGLLCDLTFYL
jgi:hypothetical protein